MPLLRKLVGLIRPDVLCLQETKCRDGEFPLAEVRDLGFDHVATFGQVGYHGVAVLSRLPFAQVERGPFCRHGHARHLAVTLGAGAAAGLAIHNFYVPAGGDEPDPDRNPKFAHKLHFLDCMARGPAEGGMRAERAVVLGDLNVAPLETDVWSHRALLGVVSHTPVETELLARVRAAGPWIDAMRERVPPTERLYTWWSYRSPDWAKADKGRRLDHVWLSADLAPTLGTVEVLRDARHWDRPSDHVPVTFELRL